MTIKAVIWDMGGVILRTADQGSRKHLAEKYNLTLEALYKQVFESDSAHQATLGKISEEEHWGNLASQFGLNAGELSDFESAFWAGDRIDMELCQFIRNLRPHWSTALLSNAWSGARGALSERYKIMDIFDQSIFSAEVGLAKPDAAIYGLILERLQVEPADAIFIDDVEKNILAARELGMHGIQFVESFKAQQDVMNLLYA